MGYSFIRQIRVLRQRKRFRALNGSKKKASFSAWRGLALTIGIAAFVGLVFILAYYVWYLPLQKSVR